MGTSTKKTPSLTTQKDHPHAYGDKQAWGFQYSQVAGSSPRVWGQAIILLLLCPYVRIIPTRMGTSQVFDFWYALYEDHPHAYGDKPIRASLPLRDVGSSPRVWGQAESCTAALYSARIIPTRMGTSHKNNVADKGTWDHPHAYGDK